MRVLEAEHLGIIFNSLNDVHLKFSHINAGGCGIVALALKRSLFKLGFLCTIHSTYNNDYNSGQRLPYDYDINQEVQLYTEEQRSMKAAPNNHLLVCSGQSLFDIDGFKNRDVFETPVQEDLLINMLCEPDCWNDCFRDHNYGERSFYLLYREVYRAILRCKDELLSV